VRESERESILRPERGREERLHVFCTGSRGEEKREGKMQEVVAFCMPRERFREERGGCLLPERGE